METLLETLPLDIDDKNELTFRIKIEGADQAPTKVRLVCENEDYSYLFIGKSLGHDDLVSFDIPSMKGKLNEGTYLSRVEVLIDNKYFTPVQFNCQFKKTISIVAESVMIPKILEKKQDIKVSASLPIIVEKKVEQKIQQQIIPEQKKLPSLLTKTLEKKILDEDSILEAAKSFLNRRK